jgi:hypothetical protein
MVVRPVSDLKFWFREGNVMKIGKEIASSLVVLMILAVACAAFADITLTTDKSTYEVGEIVHITAHNNGPLVEEFVSFPFFQIYNEDNQECVYGCVGLPVITPFGVGETVTMDYDTGAMPDIPGNYRVGIAVLGGPTTGYVLTGEVPAEASSWGSVKVLYR